MSTYDALRRQMFGLRDGIPDWHHPQSVWMRLEKADDSYVIISAPGARLTIAELLDAKSVCRWIVRWEFFSGDEQGPRGEITINAQQLCAAFALDQRWEEGNPWWAAPDQEVVCIEGVFFRYDRWLNIPGPGTGKDGDFNISVCIDGEMKKAITDMVLAGEEERNPQLSFDFSEVFST